MCLWLVHSLEVRFRGGAAICGRFKSECVRSFILHICSILVSTAVGKSVGRLVCRYLPLFDHFHSCVCECSSAASGCGDRGGWPHTSHTLCHFLQQKITVLGALRQNLQANLHLDLWTSRLTSETSYVCREKCQINFSLPDTSSIYVWGELILVFLSPCGRQKEVHKEQDFKQILCTGILIEAENIETLMYFWG